MMIVISKYRFFARFTRLCLPLALLGAAAACSMPAFAKDMPAAKAFSAVTTPNKDAPAPIGFYSKGCLAGAQAMPMSAAHWQMLHPSRNRNWGHPIMIAYLQKLADQAARQGRHGLLIGDIAQPRGGPLPFGHASHQIGLDADIWFMPMPARGLSVAERENISGGSVLRGGSADLDPKKWSAAHTNLLKLAAEDPNTDRIFVTPGIKKYLCANSGGDKAWLGKIRPYWGHKEHFHVRLKCPKGAKQCEHQAAVPKGSGCDASLDWWFTAAALPPKKPSSALTLKSPGGKKPKPKILMVSDLPKRCKDILN